MASAWARLAARGAGVACLGGMSGAALAEGDAKAKGAKGAMVGDNFQYTGSMCLSDRSTWTYPPRLSFIIWVK